MDPVRPQAQQAERTAHILDDLFHVGGTRISFGLDPLIGLIPVFGDVIATMWGTIILVQARRLGVPSSVLLQMAFNLFKNGLIGTLPVFGDVYSFVFKSHAKNTAQLLRAIKQGEDGSCQLMAQSLTLLDIGILLALTGPTVLAVGYVSLWLWNHNISYFFLFFPPPYQTRA
jgi:hypothetical protein